ncbi:MAG: hypothetical protein AB2392_19860, partial [Neobacillus sp.]
TYYKIINGKTNYEKGYQKIQDELKASISLGKKEKEKLLNSIDRRLKKFNKGKLTKQKKVTDKVKSTKIKEGRIVGYLTRIPDSLSLSQIDGYPKEWVNLTLFSDSLQQYPSGHIKVLASIETKSGKAFVTQDQIKEIKSKIGKRFFNVRGFKE